MAVAFQAFPTTAARAQDTSAEFVGTGQGSVFYNSYYSTFIFGGKLKVNRIPSGIRMRTYCIDLYSPIFFGDVLAVNGPLVDDIRGDAIDWCAVNHLLHNFIAGSDAFEAGALQAAIWHFTSANFGPYIEPTGTNTIERYQFMTDPIDSEYDGMLPDGSSALRDRAFQMINSVPRDTLGNCIASFPQSIELSTGDLSGQNCENLQVEVTGTLLDQNGNPMAGEILHFVTSDGGLASSSTSMPCSAISPGDILDVTGVTDANGEARVIFSACEIASSYQIDAWVEANYGTLLFDPAGVKQALASTETAPFSVSGDFSFSIPGPQFDQIPMSAKINCSGVEPKSTGSGSGGSASGSGGNGGDEDLPPPLPTEIPPVPEVTASDICGNPVDVTFTEIAMGECPGALTRVWVATDNFGNTSELIQMVVLCKVCVQTTAYWTHNPEAWLTPLGPVTEFELACPGDLTLAADALVILQTAPGRDESIKLAQELIAALLNIAQGADDTEIAPTIQEARDYLCVAGIGTSPRGQMKKAARGLKNILKQFNKGDLSIPACENGSGSGAGSGSGRRNSLTHDTGGFKTAPAKGR
ncbi:MAG: Ig-like domain-containing protein [Verrucomicrobiota bacterium]